MSKSVFSVDGVEYPGVFVKSPIHRSFNVLDGENAGRTMDGRMQRDIIGTYYTYRLEFDASLSDPEEYDALFEALSAPMDSHIISVPYGQSSLTFEAYVANGEDDLSRIYRDESKKWDNLTVNFVAMEPQRRPAS
jgi:hypothetical protein